MGIIDDVFSRSKEIVDAACQRSGEIVAVQKQKFNISSLKSKREKDFAQLGKLYYELVKDNDDLDDETRNLIDAINEKTDEISRLYEEMKDIKNKAVCPNCNAKIDLASVYCNNCGIKISED